MAGATEEKTKTKAHSENLDVDEAAFFSSKPASVAQTATPARESVPTESSDGFHIDVDEALAGLDPRENSERMHLSAEQLGRGSGLVAAFITLAFSLTVLAGMRNEAAYWAFGPANAVALESAQASDATFLDGHRETFVRLTGTPGGSAIRFKKMFSLRELVAVKNTAVLIERPATNIANDGTLQAPPNLDLLDVSGKLVRNDDLDDAYEQAFGMLVHRGEAVPEKGHFYLIFEGDIPRHGFVTPVIFLGLLALAGLNILFLARRFFRRFNKSAKNVQFTSENTTSAPHS